MNEQNPYEQLGVTTDASFDEIQEAKLRLMQDHQDEPTLVESIEAAYDAILMDRLKQRQQGKIPVPERIRFPERIAQAPPSFTPSPINRTPGWLQGLFDTPSRSEILLSSGVFAGLSGLVAYPGFPETSLSFVIALSVGFTFFLLNRKERRFGRSALLTLLGLFIGIGLGTLLISFVLTAIPGLGLTDQKVLTLVTFFIFWLIATFLR